MAAEPYRWMATWYDAVFEPVLSHAKQAKVKQRQIESMDKVEKPVLERRRIGLSFREGVRGGQKVVELRDVAVAFGEEPVLIGAELTVSRGERGVRCRSGARLG